jgi:hypothetical protein
VGVKAGFDATTGFGATPAEDESRPKAEYLDPEESATFLMMLSGVRS